MSNKMWGGRFASGPGAIMQEINASIDFDRRLYRQDIAASKAHAAMLAKQGIITRDDARAIAHGLDTILSEMETGKFRFKRALEDIHMNVEMAARDRGRFADARKRMNESPLGSAALAGTSFRLDRAMTAKALGFDRPAANSLDAVSDRDFVMETLAAASIAAVHLSRFAEE